MTEAKYATLRNLTQSSDFSSDVFDLLTDNIEGQLYKIYYDSKGIPTIGVGSNLRELSLQMSFLNYLGLINNGALPLKGKNPADVMEVNKKIQAAYKELKAKFDTGTPGKYESREVAPFIRTDWRQR